MSLYNKIHGYDSVARFLMQILAPIDPPRFRDCWINTEESTPRIVLFTRTGGHNRKTWERQNAALEQGPHYLLNHDDPFDKTFAHWYHQVPDDAKELIEELIKLGAIKQPPSLKEKSDAFLAKMKDPNRDPNDPQIKAALKLGQKLADAIEGNGPCGCECHPDKEECSTCCQIIRI